MERMIKHEAIKYLVAVLFVFFNLVPVSAQRFETHQTYLSCNSKLTRTIKVKTTTKFSVKRDNRITWVEYDVFDSTVKIKATINKSTEKRSCSFFLLDEAGNPVDTLEVIQYGIKSNKAVNTASKAASSTKTNRKASSTSKRSTSSSSRSTGGQCAARTKKGTRCSRQASAGSIYCWQHNK